MRESPKECRRCQHQNPGDSHFCGACGSSLSDEERCRNCGHPNPGEQKFCNNCGSELQGAEGFEGSGRRDSRTPTPLSYTPKHLAAKILQSKSALEGERKQVTVLFADVKGSMELAEQLDPEEWHKILDRFFQILTDGVHRFEGTVNQYTGDGIMALFGAPIAHEDHAQRACYAALHLRDELRRYADDLKRTKGLGFAVRMGINSGEVIIGKIGDDLRMDYTAQGHTIGLAQRMEQLADPGAIYLAERTAFLATGYFALRDLGSFRIKGVSAAQQVHELEGVGFMRTRLERSRARGFSRFVGRDEESKILDMALEKTRQGNGQVVAIVGEAGVGKSRLCHEFIQRCRASATPVYEGHCVAHGRLIPFLPVLELLRSYFGITEHDKPRDARRKIAGTIVLLDQRLEQALPLVFDFLGVSDPERPVPQLDPDARRRRLAGVLRSMADARSGREAAVFFIDDLHWVDSASESYLALLVGSIVSTRALLLVNFRPEYRGEWLQTSPYQQVPLRPLGAMATETLIAELLGSDPSILPLAERLAQRSGGNPFFVEEMVLALAEAGSLAGASGRYRLVGSVDQVSIPASVQAIIASRVDRLGEREKTVLQTAAVIGKTFTEEILRGVLALPESDVTGALERLTGAGFLYERELYPTAEYGFRHPLSQEVAYASQLGDQRVRIHGQVAHLISDLYADRHDDKAALVAHHWEQAGDLLKAADWLSRAAQWAGGNQVEEAMRYWSRVRELLRSIPESPESMSLGAEACANILLDGSRMGIPQEALAPTFLEGVDLARRSGDKRALCAFLSTYVLNRVVLASSNTLEEIRPVLEETERLTDEIEDAGTRMWAIGASAMAALFWGSVDRSIELADRGRELLSSYEPGRFRGMMAPDVALLHARGRALSVSGRPQMGLVDLTEALARASQEENAAQLCAIHAAIALMLEFCGDDRDAPLKHALEAVEYAESVGSWSARAVAYEALSSAYLSAEEWGAALEAAEQVLSIMREHRTTAIVERAALAAVARSRLESGQTTAAEEAARRAVAIPDSTDGGMLRPLACLCLVRVLLRTRGIEAAAEIESVIEQACTSITRRGTKLWLPELHVERAALARLRGDEVRRAAELREARRLFTEMGATRRASQVLEHRRRA